MLKKVGESRIKTLVQNRNGLVLAVAGLFSLNILQAILCLFLWSGLGTTFVPPEFTEPMRVGSKSRDAAYLKSLADYFSVLFLNITPSNAVERIEGILRYVHPKDYSAMKSQLQEEAKQLQKHHQSRYFTPIHFSVDAKVQTVEVIGDETYLINRKVVDVQRKAYQLGFKFENAMPYLSQFQLINKESQT